MRNYKTRVIVVQIWQNKNILLVIRNFYANICGEDCHCDILMRHSYSYLQWNQSGSSVDWTKISSALWVTHSLPLMCFIVISQVCRWLHIFPSIGHKQKFPLQSPMFLVRTFIYLWHMPYHQCTGAVNIASKGTNFVDLQCAQLMSCELCLLYTHLL